MSVTAVVAAVTLALLLMPPEMVLLPVLLPVRAWVVAAEAALVIAPVKSSVSVALDEELVKV